MKGIYYVKNMNWFAIFALFSLFVFMSFSNYTAKKKQQRIREDVASILPGEVTSFKIYPERAFAKDFDAAVELKPEAQIIIAFFQAISDYQSYLPQHDKALTQWAIQIWTDGAKITIGCYVPDLNPNIVVGEIQ